MIFHKEKTVFLHPGKTGGTSVEHVLVSNFLNKNFTELKASEENLEIMYGYSKKYNIFLHHADLAFYDMLKIMIADYKKYVTIRRPYERIVSAYFYNGKDKKFDFETFILKDLEKCYLNNNPYTKNHFGLQTKFYNSDFNVIKLENFKRDCFSHGIHITDHKHCQTKASKILNNHMDIYTQKTKDIVYSLFKDDFVTFSYKR
jgi:hypothetical protein